MGNHVLGMPVMAISCRFARPSRQMQVPAQFSLQYPGPYGISADSSSSTCDACHLCFARVLRWKRLCQTPRQEGPRSSRAIHTHQNCAPTFRTNDVGRLQQLLHFSACSFWGLDSVGAGSVGFEGQTNFLNC